MSKAVKVIRFYKTGGSDVLKIEEAQLSRPKATEVLVRVQALTISRPDLLWREGSYFEDPELPARIGYDAAGVVESVGPEVKTLKVGDRVSTFPATSLLDYTAHAEHIIYPETALLVYPLNITPVQAAAVNTGLFTAYFALAELADLKRDQHVVITAASSSMGIAAIQIAKAIGVKSIAVTRSEAKEEALREVGADQVIIAGREDVQEAILDLTDGLGAEVIYDAVAGPGLEELVWATKRSGHVIVYGHLGAMEYGTLLPLGACFLRAINVHASFRVFDFTGHSRLGLKAKSDAIDRAKKFISDGLEAEVFSAKIDRVFFGLDEYATAHRYAETNNQVGKIAVDLSNDL
jgi:NADPH:quinone reductase-like Zn-dependent oxidoreductase